jgi:hypothetical protein
MRADEVEITGGGRPAGVELDRATTHDHRTRGSSALGHVEGAWQQAQRRPFDTSLSLAPLEPVAVKSISPRPSRWQASAQAGERASYLAISASR